MDNAVAIWGGSLHFRLFHLGQHDDHAMTRSFFEELAVSDPDINLVVTDSMTNGFSPPSNGATAGRIVQNLEPLLVNG